MQPLLSEERHREKVQTDPRTALHLEREEKWAADKVSLLDDKLASMIFHLFNTIHGWVGLQWAKIKNDYNIIQQVSASSPTEAPISHANSMESLLSRNGTNQNTMRLMIEF